MAELDWVLPYLAIGPRPSDEPDWQALGRSGITLIIDLNDDHVEKLKARAFGIRHIGLRVDDPPKNPEILLPTFTQIRDSIDKESRAGGKIYLHCTAGQQRSPTCAMAYLMSKGETRQNAERRVKTARLGVWAGPFRVPVWEQALDLWARRPSGAKH